MRKIFMALLFAAGLSIVTPVTASATPTMGASVGNAFKSGSLVQEARVYCYNRYTGRFLHWGSCGGYRRHYHYYRRHYYY
jgi:hypothetical protein